jgi:hypothetical protein
MIGIPPKNQSDERFIPPGTDLSALLESLRLGGAMVHSNTAQLLFSEFNRVQALNQKRLLGGEIFCKFMQAVEDFGALCLFCLSDTPDDVHAYFSAYTKHIVKFYGKCRDGLSAEEVRTIYGMQTVEELILHGQIPESHRATYEESLGKFIASVQAALAKHGRVFSEHDGAGEHYVHSDLVNMYFNAKHGVRVYLPSPVVSQSVKLADDQIGILIDVDKVDSGDGVRNKIEVGTFDFAAVGNMVGCTKNICKELEALVTLRINTKDDPFFFLKKLRDGTADRGTVAGLRHPGRNAPCPCGSKLKFKKCHGR